jgi:type VI secretion system secreted protein VgrG
LAVTVNGNNPYEIYDFPGEHLVRAEGDRLARIRLQEQAAACVVSRGSSGCRYFMSGFKFTLQDHYRSDLNQAYLLTSVHHAATQGGDYNVGSEDQAELSYQNRFECIPFSTPFRPPRLTRRPTVQGCQTALVVGPAGEEIYTDKHGRVKVQFHWDREGKRNENSSCWVRVSHPWAGQGWGAVSIPRIGQEVIVDFLEGDPDQPIIVGRVYNGEQGVPFGMPGGAVVSGMKSKTHKGGGYNEISMNDTAGKELIQIHGQYDMDSKIGHDHRLQVTNNHSETIGVDKSSTVGGNKTISVTGTHTEHITGMMSQTVSSSKLEAISVAKALTIGAGYAVGVGAAMVEGIGGAKAQVIGGAKIVGVGAVSIETVGISKSTIAGAKISHKAGAGISSVAGASISSKAGANISGHAGAKISLAAGSNIAAKAGSKMHLESGSDYSVKSGAKAVVEAASEITLKCGSASIVLKSGGDILINGTNVSVKGSSKIGINASGDVTIKGSKIGEN